jgi:hypothetical protein
LQRLAAAHPDTVDAVSRKILGRSQNLRDRKGSQMAALARTPDRNEAQLQDRLLTLF